VAKITNERIDPADTRVVVTKIHVIQPKNVMNESTRGRSAEDDTRIGKERSEDRYKKNEPRKYLSEEDSFTIDLEALKECDFLDNCNSPRKMKSTVHSAQPRVQCARWSDSRNPAYGRNMNYNASRHYNNRHPYEPQQSRLVVSQKHFRELLDMEQELKSHRKK